MTKTKKTLTKTQAELLDVLRSLRDGADATEAEDNSRAIGGLTDVEKFRRGALLCAGHKDVIARGYVTARLVIARNVKVGTFHALEDLGLAERQGAYVRATKEAV